MKYELDGGRHQELHLNVGVYNPSKETAFDFNLLLHSYFKCPDVRSAGHHNIITVIICKPVVVVIVNIIRSYKIILGFNICIISPIYSYPLY
jgi:hypothetical protein